MNTKLDTLTVGQLRDDAFQLTRCQSTRHPTNVVEIRLTTRGLEVETTRDEDMADKLEELERELSDAEDEANSAENESNRLAEERDNLVEDVRTLELKVKELEKELSNLKGSKMP